MKVATCLTCLQEFIIKWYEQKFCSLSCSSRFPNKNRQSKIVKYGACITCEKAFEVKHIGHKYCSRSCAAKINGSKFPKREQLINYNRQCQGCLKEFTSRHSKTVFCSIKCSKECDYHKYIMAWKQGENNGGGIHGIASPVRRYLLEKYGNKCSKCGWNEINPITNRSPLQVNHIDGNGENHREDNLEILCPNCHALTPNFGALNLGKGRKYRRDKYKKVPDGLHS